MLRNIFLVFVFICVTKNTFAQADSVIVKTLNDVTVTGQFVPQTLKNSVYDLRVITQQRIQLSGAATIQQVLNTQTGIRFSNDRALGISDVQINGISGRNIKILIDGIPVPDRFDQRVSLSQIDVNTIERIEIITGPMSVSFGTDALGGVINIITKKNYQSGLSVSARVQEESAGDEYHAFNYKGNHIQNMQVNYKTSRWNLSSGGTHNDFNGFGGDQYGRGKSWLPKEQWLGNGSAGYRSGKIDIYYRLDAMKENIKDRNVINIDPDAPIAKSIDQRFQTDRIMHQLQSTLKINKSLSLSSFAGYTNLRRSTNTDYLDFLTHTTTPGTADGQQDISKLRSFSFRNTLQYLINDKISLQPGVDINAEKATGARISGNPSIEDYAFFLSAEIKPTEKINFRPGVRFIHNSVYDAPAAVPSLNTKFDLSKNLALRLGYGYGYRAPALRELYFNFVDVNHNIVGNTNLEAETSNSFNASLRLQSKILKEDDFVATLGGFYNSFKNQISLVQSLTNSLQYTYYNIDKVKTAGVNFDNRILLKNFTGSLGFSYIGYDQKLDESSFKNDAKNYLWTPEITSELTYYVAALKTSAALFYKFTGKKPAYSYETNNSVTGYYVTKTSSFNTADLTITSKLCRYLSATAGVKNIFDVTDVSSNTVVSSAVSHNAAGALSVDYGRSYFLGLNINWHK